MLTRLHLIAGVTMLPLLTGAASTQPADPIIVPLEKVSALELSKEFDYLNLARGHMTSCTSQPAQSVKKLPPLKSSKPLYGEAAFDRRYIDNKPGITFAFVIDESDGTGKDYDRLYFDLNQDGDLTNDVPVTIAKRPPEWKHYTSADLTETVFENIRVPFDHGPPLGRQPFVLLPVLNQWKEGEPNLLLIPTEARRGRLKIGKERYTVLLSQPYLVSGRYDRPYTHMNLLPEGGKNMMSHWWGGDQLCAVHVLDERLHQFSTIPTGDKLFVQPYTGEMGIIKVGPGPRKLDKLSMRGSMESPTCAVALGDIDPETNWPKDTAEATVPVGDYTFQLLYAQMGKLRLMISNNYHADGVSRIRERKIVYGIKVRKDKPFILDFTNKPEVIFASPARDQAVHPGDEVAVKAVLIDPVLDIMIRNLYDTSRKEKKSIGEGQGTYETDVSLDPTVVVTDATGKRVAEGVMPFG